MATTPSSISRGVNQLATFTVLKSLTVGRRMFTIGLCAFHHAVFLAAGFFGLGFAR